MERTPPVGQYRGPAWHVGGVGAVGQRSFSRGGMRVPIGRRGGGIGIGGILVILLISWVLGINPLTLLSGGDISLDGGGTTQQSGGQQAGTRPQGESSDETTAFVRTVLAETEDTWSGIFQSAGETYQKPTLVLFSGQVSSACGYASAASGPFYCPGDRKVYLDTSFFKELDQRFGAAGDFAQAYVIAHEVGHHIQNLTGVLPEFNRRRQSMSRGCQQDVGACRASGGLLCRHLGQVHRAEGHSRNR